jgi:class 3 adenylate cyclase
MHWMINVSHPQGHGSRAYRLNQGEVRVGRDPELEIRLDAAAVSRLHCTLSRRGERVRVADSSRNGTFVKLDGRWERVEGAQECGLPARVKVADWTVEVTAPPPLDLDACLPEATWEQSVMLPPGYLKAMTEAILVFDLCESSSIANQDDRMAHHLKRRLSQLADPVLVTHGRRFYKNTGDGFLATFPDAAGALAAAVELETRIRNRNERTQNAPLHYRIALHHGEVWAIDAGGADIHGNDVNITFRIEGVQPDSFPHTAPALPRRDRILCSRAFMAIVPSSRLAQALTGHVACGAARLKGITEPVDIHWLQTRYS